MKKEFLTPVISICTFSAEDIITASGMTTAQEMVQSELNTKDTFVFNWVSEKE